MPPDRFLPYCPARLELAETDARAESFYRQMNTRRSVRHFSADAVPKRLIQRAIETASTAPSGAHRQPWTFVAVSSAAIKRQIRIAAETEERQSYEGGRMPREWLEAIAPLGTDWRKPFLETVPWIVVVFEHAHGTAGDGHPIKFKNYYVKESVGIACGLFIAAIHNMGLATLTHTPSPMAFLSTILKRPANEKPFILFPIGYPASDAKVPELRRKGIEDVSEWITD